MRPGVPPDCRRWVEASVGGRIVRVARLLGGITSDVHLVTVEAPNGARTSVVLRQWAGGPAVERRLDVLALEAAALQALEGTQVPAPRLLEVSDGASTDGVAALLMTRVAGRVDLSPADPDRWIRQMAATLTTIHHVDVDLPAFTPEGRRPPDDPPRWAERPAVWRAALEAVQGGPPATTPCFAHGDYQHFNVLWSRGRLAGVVDWVNAVSGPPDLDVAHCALNLTILYGVDRAEAFRHAYEEESGRTVGPWWDLHRLTGYDLEWQAFIPVQVAGRVPVDVAGMTRRVEDAMASALRRR